MPNGFQTKDILADLKLPFYNGGSLVLQSFCSVSIRLIHVSFVCVFFFIDLYGKLKTNKNPNMVS